MCGSAIRRTGECLVEGVRVRGARVASALRDEAAIEAHGPSELRRILAESVARQQLMAEHASSPEGAEFAVDVEVVTPPRDMRKQLLAENLTLSQRNKDLQKGLKKAQEQVAQWQKHAGSLNAEARQTARGMESLNAHLQAASRTNEEVHIPRGGSVQWRAVPHMRLARPDSMTSERRLYHAQVIRHNAKLMRLVAMANTRTRQAEHSVAATAAALTAVSAELTQANQEKQAAQVEAVGLKVHVLESSVGTTSPTNMESSTDISPMTYEELEAMVNAAEEADSAHAAAQMRRCTRSSSSSSSRVPVQPNEKAAAAAAAGATATAAAAEATTAAAKATAAAAKAMVAATAAEKAAEGAEDTVPPQGSESHPPHAPSCGGGSFSSQPHASFSAALGCENTQTSPFVKPDVHPAPCFACGAPKVRARASALTESFQRPHRNPPAADVQAMCVDGAGGERTRGAGRTSSSGACGQPAGRVLGDRERVVRSHGGPVHFHQRTPVQAVVHGW
jgi:hypothetical protein